MNNIEITRLLKRHPVTRSVFVAVYPSDTLPHHPRWRRPVHISQTPISIPQKMTSGAAGFDLQALESKLIQPQTMVSIRMGIAIEIPKGYYGAIKGRSGNAFYRNMIIFNDAIYSEIYEEIIILVLNVHQTETLRIQEGERIAQIIITKIHPAGLTIESAPHSSE